METPKTTRTKWLEAIVICVCVLIAFALLMPAVQNDRDRGSRRAQCVNNLKQLSLATTNFETSMKVLPSIQSSFATQDGRGKLGSWVVSLLPMIEEQELRDRWDDVAMQEQWEKEFRSLKKSSSTFYPRLESLVCSSDNTKESIAVPLSYLANAGLYVRFDLPESEGRANPDPTLRDPVLDLAAYQGVTDASQLSSIAQRPANGLLVNSIPKQVYNPRTNIDEKCFGVTSAPVRSKDCKDGLSKTILFAENLGQRSWADVSTTDDSVRYSVGFIWLYAGHDAAEGRPRPTPAPGFDTHNNPIKEVASYKNAQPSSMHSGVFNVAMADCSVQTLSVGIDYVVYQAFATPQTVKSDMPNHRWILKPIDFE